MRRKVQPKKAVRCKAAERKRGPAKEVFLIKHPPQGGDLRVHLVYPNSYRLGMSNLGLQTIYRLFAEQPGVVIERGFFPEKGLRSGAKPPATFEHGRNLADCDVLAFSVSFEGDYFNLVKMLRALGLLRLPGKGTSAAGGFNPLIAAGGIAPTLNPEPLADLMDFVFLGEAEDFIAEFISCLRQARQSNLGREELLWRLAAIEGIYVPALYEPLYGEDGRISGYKHMQRPALAKAAQGRQEDFGTSLESPRPRRRVIKDLSGYQTCSCILSSDTEFGGMFLLETGRGCEMGCRFCVSGYACRPVRRRSVEALKKTLRLGLSQTESIGLVGAAVSSHPGLIELGEEAIGGGSISVSSLMAHKIGPELARILAAGGCQSAALAPETGSDRLRLAAGKRIANDQFIKAAELLALAGLSRLKLYFMLGLPGETDADVAAIPALAAEIRDQFMQRRGKRRQAAVTLSLNAFVPKPFTPFQWEPMAPLKELEAKLKAVKQAAGRICGLKVSTESPRYSYFQALLSRGDRRMGQLLAGIAERGADWQMLINLARSKKGDWLNLYLKRRIPFNDTLPWEIIDCGLERGLLQKEAEQARSLMNGGETR